MDRLRAPFDPETNASTNVRERVEWLRQLLVGQGVWRGFENSTDYRLSNFFRPTNGLEPHFSGVADWAIENNRFELLNPLLDCATSQAGQSMICNWLSARETPAHDHCFEKHFRRLPIHKHKDVLALALSRRKAQSYGFLMAHLDPVVKTVSAVRQALEAEAEAVGKWVLAGIDPLEAIRHNTIGPEQRLVIDRWWCQCIQEGTLPMPETSRSLSNWAKRLPCLKALLTEKRLEETLPAAPVPAQRKPRM